MGFFDFLKPKPKLPAEEQEGPSVHYVFAHYALRQVALAQPLQFLAIMASPESGRFLADLLEDVEKTCGSKASFSAEEINIHPGRGEDFVCVVVELPEPQEVAEASLVALVAELDMSSETTPDPSEVEGRYFTLEKGVTLENEPRTVLGEWRETSHANYGDGPDVVVKDFVDAIRGKLDPQAVSQLGEDE